MGFFVKIDYLRFHGWIEAWLFSRLTNCIICYCLVPSIDWYENECANWFWSINNSCFVRAVQNLKNLSALDTIELSLYFWLSLHIWLTIIHIFQPNHPVQNRILSLFLSKTPPCGQFEIRIFFTTILKWAIKIDCYSTLRGSERF